MAENIFSRIATIINRMVDIISQGSLERFKILKEFNFVFKEAWEQKALDRLCTVTTSPGDPSFKHELSTFYLRSGFKITVENDDGLTEKDYGEISKYVVESKPFVRQLMALGYDTLIIKGKHPYHQGFRLSLKEIANFQDYMIDTR